MNIRRILVALLLFFSATPCFAESIKNGKYELLFRISDMGFSQIIEIRNSTESPSLGYYKFDVLIQEKGALKRFDDDNQVVKGIVYNKKFRFILPYANVATLDGFYFEGANESENGVFRGTGDVPYQGPNVGNNTFNFILKKINP